MTATVFQNKTKTTAGYRTGRLGIDIGSSSIKIARMEWLSGRWTITNRLLLPVTASADLPESALSNHCLPAALQILKQRRLSENQHASCVLPMSVTDVRSVEVPSGSAEEVKKLATEALRTASPDLSDRIITLWQHAVTPNDRAMVSAVSISPLTGESVVNSLSEVGLKCCSIETVPFAMTRASQMTPGGRTVQPVGLLDWGHRTATFVVAYHGRPEFVRSFNHCGSGRVLKALSELLGFSPEDTQHLLAASGSPGNSSGHPRTAVSRAVEQNLQLGIRDIAAEIKKSLVHLREHIPRLQPGRMMLFGGMAAVPNIAAAFHDQCGIETKPWSLDADNSHHSDSVFALALATSAREIS